MTAWTQYLKACKKAGVSPKEPIRKWRGKDAMKVLAKLPKRQKINVWAQAELLKDNLEIGDAAALLLLTKIGILLEKDRD